MAEPTPTSATPEKPVKGAKGKRPRAVKKEKKNIPHAIATVQASFNNTVITVADQEGGVLAWSSAGRIGFKGSRKGTPFRGPARRGQLRRGRQGAWSAVRGRARDGPRGRPGVGHPGAPGQRAGHQVHQGHDADPAQRVQASEAEESVKQVSGIRRQVPGTEA